ncbi:PKD domain protein [Thermoplasmatales archaeon BRNA1]|nr:PKD domain protein [Thermoplasmatales archaeon BRNA1]
MRAITKLAVLTAVVALIAAGAFVYYSDDSEAASNVTVNVGEGNVFATGLDCDDYDIVDFTVNGSSNKQGITGSRQAGTNNFILSFPNQGTYFISFMGLVPMMGVNDQGAEYNVTTNAAEPGLSFTNPGPLSCVSGSSFSYTMSTNIEGSSFAKIGGNASWLGVSGAVLSGTVPNVSSVTSYDCVIRATSPGGQTAEQTVTFYVYPKLTASNVTVFYTAGTAPVSVPQFDANMAVSAVATTNLGVAVAVNGSLSVPAALTEATDSTFSVRLTATEGPAQYKDVTVRVVVTPVLSVDVAADGSYLVAGTSYSEAVSATVGSAVITVQNAPAWVMVSNGNLILSVPGTIAEVQDVTFTVTASVAASSTTLAQTDSVTVTFHIEPVIEWTTVPTAAMMIVPIDVNVSTGSKIGASIGEHMAAFLLPYDTLSFQFFFMGSDAQTVHWDFGDGASSDEWCPVHTYAKEGRYTVTLTATNTEGSSSTDSVLVASGRLVAAEDWWDEYGDYIVLTVVGIIGILAVYFLFMRKPVKTMKAPRRH